MDLESRRGKRVSHLVGIGLVLGFMLPHSGTIFLMVNPLLCILFWLLNREKRLTIIALLVVISFSISILINLTQVSSLKPLLVCMTILLYAICFPMTDIRVKVPRGYFTFPLIVILLTQVAYILDVSFITNFLDTVYPIEGELENMYSNMRSNITLDNMLNYRLGGLYRNPNQCARALTLLMASYLLLFRENRTLWFAILAFVGVVLTGSRTGFVIATLIIVAYIFYCLDVSTIIKVVVVAASISGVTYMLIAGSDLFRAIDIASGVEQSSTIKYDTFVYYIQNEQSFVRLLFGYIDPERFRSGYSVIDQFDADYGYLVFNYGIFGFIMIMVFNLTVFLRTSKQGRIFFLVLLWMLTSTIFSSYRAVFIYFLLLSLVYNQYRDGHYFGGLKL